MVRIHDDPVEQLVDEHSTFSVVSFSPDSFEVERGEHLEHLLEAFGDLVVLDGGALITLHFRPESFDLQRETGFFDAE